MKRIIFLILAAAAIFLLIFAASRKNSEMSAIPSNPDAGPGEDTVETGQYIPPTERPPMPGIFDNYGDGAYPPDAVTPSETWSDGYFPQLDTPDPDAPYVTLHTNKGDIKVVLYPEAAPLTVKNFIVHCRDGYYDGTEFHRIVKDFMIQGGDPLGTGQGGESIYGIPFRDEINAHLHHFRGALSMASWGTCMNASQFFIVQGNEFKKTYRPEKADIYKSNMMQNRISTEVYTELYDYMFRENPSDGQLRAKLGELIKNGNDILAGGYVPDINIDRAMELYPEVGGSPHLDYMYTVFGQVVEGMDVVDAIADSQFTAGGDGGKIIIESTTVENAPSYETETEK